jgi:hypothetical protein
MAQGAVLVESGEPLIETVDVEDVTAPEAADLRILSKVVEAYCASSSLA